MSFRSRRALLGARGNEQNDLPVEGVGESRGPWHGFLLFGAPEQRQKALQAAAEIRHGVSGIDGRRTRAGYSRLKKRRLEGRRSMRRIRKRARPPAPRKARRVVRAISGAAFTNALPRTHRQKSRAETIPSQ